MNGSGMTSDKNRRILIVDDQQAIHDDFRKVLHPERAQASLDALERALFDDAGPSEPKLTEKPNYELSNAFQGQEALALLKAGLARARPYALAFVDMRMPPGWDGVQTIEQLWKADPALQVVICTAYSDYSSTELLQRFEADERLLVLKKPFDAVEVAQLAGALTEKWNLAREHSQRLVDLDQARLLAERATQIKIAFLTNMSHELRTPLHAVISFARLGLDSTDEASRQAFFERIVAGGERLQQLVENLLDVSKLTAGKMSLQSSSHDIEALIREVAVQLQPVLRSKRLQLDIARAKTCPSSLAPGDPSRLKQVFTHVLTNAARYSPSEGRIEIRLNLYERINRDSTLRSGLALEVAVRDYGVGIPANELELVFDEFFQSSRTRTNAGGTGLGLAICKKLMTLHGGTIEARTPDGPGALIRIRLPLVTS
jgi:signal transduction histidine kinase